MRVGMAEIGAEAVSRVAAILAGEKDTEIRRVVSQIVRRASALTDTAQASR
jgi:LacI family transcriptional regulator